ncbi:hypothetical protein COY65_02050 [Candidatus Jorgensenbacteria bacterium CG_4_10_14_0_8_um_filter_39_13]|uniref:Clp R domain-containing protein n=2 Tax=Candidatus Joergenseniibacteriota TaxID=1752739 RepID=A0A2M7RGY8_9BACT|nr:MAG: hypothetical protein COV54_02955 [Candidatus Jorgensenbacteria bacterium CG11_big_fil_rev_8_21_14_0_20_38_23]PIV13015.1 MAG: hypothetical protein COS46_02300 [Candidatus Jorgensenbacteria bacterium CG03_land_8_20_14_0_80_38_39]PIW97539.1 MAG: hypothetical protein COZ81_02190 [Candidatus Jorgensenbacteria bacterium CG_4_8_14_3_um_filter_38_10]PIY95842.1 MAG: hypothetical protein COY65_02050 [Candidatus Jorgensenbacteria bacterium CG_4_10_14_0_8_um_filter_39_13]
MNRFYFYDPLLNLSLLGNSLVKISIYVVYAILAVSLPVLFFSDFLAFRWLGLLLSLFLIDRLSHFGQAEKSLSELKREPKKKKINLANYLTPKTHQVIMQAFLKSSVFKKDFHVLLLKELIEQETIKEIFKRLDISLKEFEEKLEGYLEQSKETAMKNDLKNFTEGLVMAAFQEAGLMGERFIEPYSILSALMAFPQPCFIKLLELFNLSAGDIREASIFGRYSSLFARLRQLPRVLGGFGHFSYRLRHRVINRAWTSRPTSVLDSLSTDLTDLARNEKIGFLIGHDKEFQRLVEILCRAVSPNALLVGEPGVGKSALVAHLAFLIVKDQVPPALFDKRLVSLDIGSLVASATPDVLAGRLKTIVDEIFKAGNIILHIPNFENLFRTAGPQFLNAIDIFLPILKSSAFPVIAETYPRELKQWIEPRSEIFSMFEVLQVQELTQEESVRFLVFDSLILEKSYKIFISFKAIKKAVELAYRYFRQKVLPLSAEDLLKQALAEAARQRLKRVDEDLVIAVAEERSQIPIQRAGEKEIKQLLDLEKLIHERLVNQNQAVNAVAEALREYRSGLARKGGPIAAFLFVGPTGVGKTELSKILAKLQFGSENAMIRFDMSEYQEKQTISRFLGAPSFNVSGALTDSVLQKPYSLILLDEFEKAHPDILNLFLQVFDEGRLTDSLGRLVDFQNTIIIATSNAHSEFIVKNLEAGQPIEAIADELKKKLTSIFKPELLNRFSDVIVFRNLELQEIKSIVQIQLNDLAKSLKETQNIGLDFEEGAISEIAELGYNPVFGARPMRQVISSKIKSRLSEKILKKEIGRGNSLKVSFENNDFQFKLVE